MDRHLAAFHIKLQHAQASNYWYASRRRYFRDRQALNHDLQSRKDCRIHLRDTK